MESEEARELLGRERARIERALAGVSRQQDDDQDSDHIEGSDAGAELTEDSLGEGLEDRLRAELEAVERAERRLADGSYGVSVESGEPIPDARLRTIPWAERTTEEQARLDAPAEP